MESTIRGSERTGGWTSQFNNGLFNVFGDPIGTPRINLFNLRFGVQIVWADEEAVVLLLYQNSQAWRGTSGRTAARVPKSSDEPRWRGYSGRQMDG